MTDDDNRVLIDTDFFIRFTESNPDGELFLAVMEELNKKPVMHEYVFQYELNGNASAKKLVSEGKIQILSYDSFINEINDNNYKILFCKLYKVFNYQEFQPRSGDVYTYQHEKENLGEIRSALMAFYVGIDLLLSNDGSAKSNVRTYLSSDRHPISVLNVYDTLELIAKKRNKELKWSEIKGLAKRVLSEKRYDMINSMWHHDI